MTSDPRAFAFSPGINKLSCSLDSARFVIESQGAISKHAGGRTNMPFLNHFLLDLGDLFDFPDLHLAEIRSQPPPPNVA